MLRVSELVLDILSDDGGGALSVPTQVRQVVLEAVKYARPVGIHLHNTRSTGFANAWAALEWGATIFDAFWARADRLIASVR